MTLGVNGKPVQPLRCVRASRRCALAGAVLCAAAALLEATACGAGTNQPPLSTSRPPRRRERPATACIAASVVWIAVVGGMHLPGIRRRDWGGPEFVLSAVQLVVGTMLILTLLGC